MLDAGIAPFGDHQIDGFSPNEFNIGPRGIEVRVVRNNVTLLAHHAEENSLSRSALVGGDDVAISKNVLHRIAKAIEALAARVALISFHNGGPLVCGHGARAGVGQQINQYISSGKKE